ncbi:beta-galactosidase trimerization domain-containing protein [Pelagovum pacificum]|uniref:Tat pathway signal protein n=1 Tax=Pelagovum pacificum TaxID=2588711 RepID=A0A5C5GG97_9RHOB|nr:beta-galactosidase trimerization domain-containing protein [Pelagovum pacificum]QQA44325.1 beta-galactosidase trimerization domain-containing protein [Pelagovum pacificum]TNY32556.1 Tat pathway signal protein [Pelagovum pacificum]
MEQVPWYERTMRWAQTNLTEIDPARYDNEWWREQWKRTKTQGVIINAGGIVAYYPTEMPLHHRAEHLGDRDLYGEIVKEARAEGLTVIARMDSNRVAPDFLDAHPEWICRHEDGSPIQIADKYVTCIHSAYYSEYLPDVMREIIARSSPDGFADNSWAGLPRRYICHCETCRESFAGQGHGALPTKADWDDPTYRAWIDWNYRRRTELWIENNKVTQEAGGEHCRWMGMISGEVLYNSVRFIDLRSILEHTPIIMLDHQRRSKEDGFEQNTEAGKRLHELVGWDRFIPESMPQYQLGSPAFRHASMPAAEVRLWSTAGFAGGIQPWWHHIGANHDDRRQYQTAKPIFTWHEANEDVLKDRKPAARIGIVWSQANNDLHGRDMAAERTQMSYRGTVKALTRACLDWIPVEVRDIPTDTSRFDALVLPEIGVLSDEAAAALTSFVEAGGGIVATGETGVRDTDGSLREIPALVDLLGVTPDGANVYGDVTSPDPNIEVYSRHTYLRLSPEFRSTVDGPKDDTAPERNGERHPILAGLDQTDSVPFGGRLVTCSAGPDVEVVATFVPEFPIFPPETSWMREPKTDIPAITVRRHGSGRAVAMLADLDRCYGREGSFEHADILANAVRWATGKRQRIGIAGGYGLVALTSYVQGDDLIVHLTNRIIAQPVPGRQEVIVPIGPLEVSVSDCGAASAELRVAGTHVNTVATDGGVKFVVDQLQEHEVIVIRGGA